ncbi:BQ2448_2421 [Microbotryum intermedium]|uniref:BQ2448_2421 protein n=1 Tax=Microbotryum intermedium TaxID=269621 RepID=A0A238FBD3_9BASI|nr:BQ2448_2421 [Microbotryum intermedium]
MRTALTDVLGIKYPIVVAPMAGAAGGLLASAAIQSGAFGLIAGGHTPVQELQKQIILAREALGLGKEDASPFGIGLICWKFEPEHGEPDKAQAFLETIIEAKVKGVWLSFGAEVEKWVGRIRKMEKEAMEKEAMEKEERDGVEEAKRRTRMRVFVAGGCVDEVLQIKEWEGVDIVAAQGIESGGHGPTYKVGLPIISFVPTVASQFAPTVPSAPLLLGSGGIATGAQLVAVLALGASGAVIGTAFLPTVEATYSIGQKKRIISAKGEETVRSMNFDHARGTLGWGEHVDGRGLRNLTTEESIEDVSSEEGMRRYTEAVKQDDTKRIIVWAGTSVSLVGQDSQGGDFAKTETIIKRIVGEAEEAIQRVARLEET